MTVNLQQAQTFLRQHFDHGVSNVEEVGAGAWSRCYGFRYREQELVVRFGNYVDDFQTDKRAYRYNSPDLPVPRVSDIGEAFGGYYAISSRVYGSPLEHLNTLEWRAVIPSLASALEAMRLADISNTSGFGGWDSEGNGLRTSWSEHLLAVSDDLPHRRTYGWKEKLKTSPEDDETFAWGYDLLESVAHVSIPRCLVHSDLINRNVLVKNDNISGVFDWGCALYGDHLYDLAWFEFWAPWHPELNTVFLRVELEQCWREAAYTPENMNARLLACYLHIGLDHLAYNAHLGDWATLRATAQRIKNLVV